MMGISITFACKIMPLVWKGLNGNVSCAERFLLVPSVSSNSLKQFSMEGGNGDLVMCRLSITLCLFERFT